MRDERSSWSFAELGTFGNALLLVNLAYGRGSCFGLWDDSRQNDQGLPSVWMAGLSSCTLGLNLEKRGSFWPFSLGPRTNMGSSRLSLIRSLQPLQPIHKCKIKPHTVVSLPDGRHRRDDTDLHDGSATRKKKQKAQLGERCSVPAGAGDAVPQPPRDTARRGASTRPPPSVQESPLRHGAS
ncbi:hypothetical protein CB1_000568071 [Camelus ferus]|nr:hypothetical protein CB1_000568071 [Camelus ferus]